MSEVDRKPLFFEHYYSNNELRITLNPELSNLNFSFFNLNC